uniref:Uncharacterized protein n=1 Tax=Glossina austeni TaxID=7395 RepID=A0A1A9UPQ3_GLOAU
MVIASTGALLSNNIRAAKSCSPWAAICKAAKPFLVFETIEALCASSVSMTSTWPERAAQCNGVRPSRVVTSIRAFFFNKSFSILILPHLQATCNDSNGPLQGQFKCIVVNDKV